MCLDVVPWYGSKIPSSAAQQDMPATKFGGGKFSLERHFCVLMALFSDGVRLIVLIIPWLHVNYVRSITDL